MDVLIGIFAQAPDFFVFLFLLVIGYIFGRIAEARHYRSIRAREQRLANVLIFSNRFPPNQSQPQEAILVSGSAVISDDYFKQAVAGLQTLFGGRLRSYEALVDRARREAVLRMKADAARRRSKLVINVKFQTYAVPGKSAMGAVELLAYGTALVPLTPGAPHPGISQSPAS